MDGPPLPTRQCARIVPDDHVSTIPLSWADIQEQADALGGDYEASIMGTIPPVPDDWIVPKKVARTKSPRATDEQVQVRNAFNCLAEDGLRRWFEERSDLPAAPLRAPSTSSLGSHPSSAPLSAPSRLQPA